MAPRSPSTSTGPGPASDRSLIVSLDAMTGQVHETESVEVDLGWQLSIPSTRTAMIGTVRVYGGERGIVALDLESLEERWRWQLPYGCGFDDQMGTPQLAAAVDVVLTTYYCVPDETGDPETAHGEVVLLALDERTGEQRWRHAVPYEKEVQVFDQAELEGVPGPSARVRGARPFLEAFVQTSADGRAVLLDAINPRCACSIDFPAVVFDARTGKQLWRGQRDGSVTEVFDSRAIEQSKPVDGPRDSVRQVLADGARNVGAISQGICRSGERPDAIPRSTGVIGQSLIEHCAVQDGRARGRRAWRFEVSSWPRPGPSKVIDIGLDAGEGAAHYRPVTVTAAPGVIAVHARASWGPMPDGNPL